MKPRCFCSPKVADCPKCRKPDYSKMKSPQGKAETHRILAARLTLRGSQA